MQTTCRLRHPPPTRWKRSEFSSLARAPRCQEATAVVQNVTTRGRSATCQETETVLAVTIRVDPPPPLETRLPVLENTVQQHREQHAEDVTQLKNYARKEAAEAIDYMQNSVHRELTRLVAGVRVERSGQAVAATLVASPAMLASGLC
jgi:hypothetical protein